MFDMKSRSATHWISTVHLTARGAPLWFDDDCYETLVCEVVDGEIDYAGIEQVPHATEAEAIEFHNAMKVKYNVQ
jgi:hypothetical protein